MERIVNRRRFVSLLQTINKHLAATGMSPTQFGREALHDGRFVSDLRNGREPRPITVRRVHDYIAKRVAA